MIFPALILASDTTRIPGVEAITPKPFETGIWSGGVIITSIIIFGLVFLHHKQKIKPLSRLFEKIFSFEISKKVSLIILGIILIIYISSTAGELLTEERLGDYPRVKKVLQNSHYYTDFGYYFYIWRERLNYTYNSPR